MRRLLGVKRVNSACFRQHERGESKKAKTLSQKLMACVLTGFAVKYSSDVDFDSVQMPGRITSFIEPICA